MFRSVKLAKLTPAAFGGYWAMERGYADMPHRAVGCRAIADDGSARVLLDWLYEIPTSDMDFGEFAHAVRRQHHMTSVCITSADAATSDILRTLGLTPIIIKPGEPLAADLLVPEGTTRELLLPFERATYAAAAAAIEATEDLVWV